MKLNVLHVDDSALELARVGLALQECDLGIEFVLRGVRSIADGLSAIEEGFFPDCVILDIVMDQQSHAGLTGLRELRRMGFTGSVIMMSNVTDPQLTLACMRAGASDFISKGFDDFELPLRIGKACGILDKIGLASKDALPHRIGGKSIADVYALIPDLVKSQVRAVLVTGETGTGKEVVADGFKAAIPKEMPFVPVNCAAIKEDLLESELFGHQKGSFTGANQQHRGLFSVADGGWIFLDEVARLSPTCQAALLRVLECGELRSVGSNKIEKVAVRVLAATNENLDAMAAEGKFRMDLLLRLSGYRIRLQPLRERVGEIPEIIDALLSRMSETSSLGEPYQLTPALRGLLLNHSWQEGNVRELWQALQSLTVSARSHILGPDCVPAELMEKLILDAPAVKGPDSIPTMAGGAVKTAARSWQFPLSLYSLEDDLFLELLLAYKAHLAGQRMSQRKVSAEFGISRKALQGYLARLQAKNLLPMEFVSLMAATEGAVGSLAMESNA
jgi:DNA-binding NtrC family response regulator